MNAVIYIRVSTDRQDEKNQLKSCQEFCKLKGWPVNKIYKDHGKSAFKEDVNRPEYEQMLRDAKKKVFEHIVVFELDRFSRKPDVEVIDLVKTLNLLYNVKIHAVIGDEWRDLVEAINGISSMGFMGKALAEFLETVIIGLKARAAHNESLKLSQRVKQSNKFQKALEKGTVGRPEIEINTMVVDDLRSKGYSIRKIATKLGVSKSKIESCLKNLAKKNDFCQGESNVKN